MIKFNCQNCPAVQLRTPAEIERIKNRFKLGLIELSMIGTPELFILCESYPDKAHVYETYKPANGGLRKRLKAELYGEISDLDFITSLRKDKIFIADCAFCPLPKLRLAETGKMRRAATACLCNHGRELLLKYYSVPIITLFPARRGFFSEDEPEIARRVLKNFPFDNIFGLRDYIDEKILKRENNVLKNGSALVKTNGNKLKIFSRQLEENPAT